MRTKISGHSNISDSSISLSDYLGLSKGLLAPLDSRLLNYHILNLYNYKGYTEDNQNYVKREKKLVNHIQRNSVS